MLLRRPEQVCGVQCDKAHNPWLCATKWRVETRREIGQAAFSFCNSLSHMVQRGGKEKMEKEFLEGSHLGMWTRRRSERKIEEKLKTGF